MPRPVKLIIDTDPGIDDAMAIFYAAAAPEIEIAGLTTIFGNVTVQQATRNALRLLDWAGLTGIPVASGAEKPRALPAFPPSHNVHGPEGFGDLPAETPKASALHEPAAEFLSRMARTHPGEITLCPIGPLTNIADAIDLDPDFTRNIKEIVLMGGSLDAGGNITPAAEANIYHDPHAAEHVFASGANITMVGLDVTNKILCQAPDFTDVTQSAPRMGGLLEKMSEFYLHFYTTVGKFDGCGLHDPAAIIACTHPELFTAQPEPITVTCAGETSGETLRASDGRGATNVLVSAQFETIKTLFLDRLKSLD